MKYISVIHNWHVHSKGFIVNEINADSKEHAQLQHEAAVHRANKPFSEAGGILIKIGDSEALNQPRKLTWKERLTGYTRSSND